ncbi:endodeoxyribonuclease [Methylorubrum extorquens]|uniref:endodeoxyribonuclease n=1 Tax=Methylorubrum extorquens TaxID=408 RepID=UPI0022382C73|nr:endodeoxyribonuclease [Methylorubrum extorquens]UYW27698.1 endodeoxyribonuclease [Methylorubrum extorquens]
MPGYRNRLEARVGATLPPEYAYESTRLPYTLAHHYLPDFIDTAAKRIVEVKGRFPASDRAKMKAIRKQYPDYKIEIRFQAPQTKIAKNSKTSYADWCEKNDIAWSKA